MDETGIYFRAVPDVSLCFSTDKLSGCKKAKERVTALVWTVVTNSPILS